MKLIPSCPAMGQRGDSGSIRMKLPTRTGTSVSPMRQCPGPPDDHVHLFLSRHGFIVFHARLTGGQVKPVDAKGLDAEFSSHEPHHPAWAGALDVLDVDHRVPHAGQPYRSSRAGLREEPAPIRETNLRARARFWCSPCGSRGRWVLPRQPGPARAATSRNERPRWPACDHKSRVRQDITDPNRSLSLSREAINPQPPPDR